MSKKVLRRLLLGAACSPPRHRPGPRRRRTGSLPRRTPCMGVAGPEGASEAHHRVRRHRLHRDADARQGSDPEGHDDGEDRRAAEGEPGRRPPLAHRAHLREGCDARRRDGDPDPENRPQEGRDELQPPGQGVPHHRRTGPGSSPRATSTTSTSIRRSPPSVFKPGIEIPLRPFPGTLAVGIDPDDPVPAQGRLEGPHGAGEHAPALEERVQHGHQRADRRVHHLHPGVPRGRAHLDRRLALRAGQRRGEPHRDGVLVRGDRDPAHRAQGHEAHLAAHRDQDALDHGRLRRGPRARRWSTR